MAASFISLHVAEDRAPSFRHRWSARPTGYRPADLTAPISMMIGNHDGSTNARRSRPSMEAVIEREILFITWACDTHAGSGASIVELTDGEAVVPRPNALLTVTMWRCGTVTASSSGCIISRSRLREFVSIRVRADRRVSWLKSFQFRQPSPACFNRGLKMASRAVESKLSK